MNLFSYKMDHDFGLAPNPFWGFMSLAVCKGQIRRNKNLQIGDWIIATGAKSLGYENRLIYAMKVEKIITFDEYWSSPEYGCKIPVMNGTLSQLYGDNFYHTLADGKIIQEPSAHSNSDSSPNESHKERDTRGKNVLLSKEFFYFGDKAPLIPQYLQEVICNGRDYACPKIPENIREAFVRWLKSNYTAGIYGEPISWKNFNLPELKTFQDENQGE